MKHVEVVISSYNGEKYIERQLDTIFSQKNVFVTCIVRDDGSTDNTVGILKNYATKNKNLRYVEGKNLGWERSFLEALKLAGDADYYAFSDQDDVWFENKLYKSISKLLKVDCQEQALLFHCNKISTDEKLIPAKEQARKIEKPKNRKSALIQEYVQGCSAVMNKAAKELVCQYTPKAIMPHDYWVGLLVYYFGTVIYDSEPLFYHVNTGKNASQDGHLIASRMKRLKGIINKSGYPNPSKDLIKGYSKYLTEEDLTFLKNTIEYKNNFKIKLELLLDKQLRRNSNLGTLAFKWCIMVGQF
ncbi:MAG: glycosyltransferase [Clostridiaceae bacterium]|nr:glycosyltransferase [Clostridiaceae bacterium]